VKFNVRKRQGLTFSNGILFESTGLYGQSKVRKLDYTTGEVIASVDLGRQYFGEGMTVTDNNTLIQITWKEQQGFVYDATTLEQIGGFTYSTTSNEGWGITYIPHVKQLVVSDGSNMLHFWDATVNTFPELKRIPVQRKDGTSVNSINELEYYHGYILANIWYSDTILKIHPETGLIEHEYDFSTLWPPEERVGNGDVLNGISISDKDDELFVTGKLWPKIYRVRLKGI
jgi:glutamine cyclotransferase